MIHWKVSWKTFQSLTPSGMLHKHQQIAGEQEAGADVIPVGRTSFSGWREDSSRNPCGSGAASVACSLLSIHIHVSLSGNSITQIYIQIQRDKYMYVCIGACMYQLPCCGFEIETEEIIFPTKRIFFSCE